MIDIFEEAERIARAEADRHDAWEASEAGKAAKAARIADDIRRGIRDEDGHFKDFGDADTDGDGDDEEDDGGDEEGAE